MIRLVSCGIGRVSFSWSSISYFQEEKGRSEWLSCICCFFPAPWTQNTLYAKVAYSATPPVFEKYRMIQSKTQFLGLECLANSRGAIILWLFPQINMFLGLPPHPQLPLQQPKLWRLTESTLGKISSRKKIITFTSIYNPPTSKKLSLSSNDNLGIHSTTFQVQCWVS